MIDNRPEADHLLVARLMGAAKHHAKWRELTADEEAAAVTALRELAAGRADLLAEVAAILEGFAEGELSEPLDRRAADLCRKAGADPEAIPAWIEKGRRRRTAATMPPPSGGVRGGGAPQRGRP
jgi:acyl-CoA reductase-like NAD-dependent aldehyde dehydrogenase